MQVKIEPSWYEVLKEEFEKAYFINLANFLKKEYKTKTIYPKGNNIFNAFNLCPFHKLKVVILGQDPYHGPNQAHGLAFSVPDGIATPPSLKNIFLELESDLNIKRRKTNLSDWAEQGMLLLNTILTVEANKPTSHANIGWEIFTDSVIKIISEKKNQIIFVLWGSHAQKKEILIDTSRHFVIKSAHPSPLSANRGFLGSKPFSKINQILESINQKPIKWG